MTDIYPVKDEVRARALIDAAGYEKMNTRSVEDNEGFCRSRPAVSTGSRRLRK